MHIVYNEHVHVQCSECTMHMYKDVLVHVILYICMRVHVHEHDIIVLVCIVI